MDYELIKLVRRMGTGWVTSFLGEDKEVVEEAAKALIQSIDPYRSPSLLGVWKTESFTTRTRGTVIGDFWRAEVRTFGLD